MGGSHPLARRSRDQHHDAIEQHDGPGAVEFQAQFKQIDQRPKHQREHPDLQRRDEPLAARGAVGGGGRPDLDLRDARFAHAATPVARR